MFSLGKNRRILRRSDFLRVQAEGERAARTPHFVLLVAKGAPDAASRLGIVVTRKVGNAVVRNRIKRLCRECFRLWPDLVPSGIDFVVIAREGADELGLEGVRREWTRARKALLGACKGILAGKSEATA